MIIRCAWHLRNFGKVAIIGKKKGRGITDSICEDCLKIELGEVKCPALNKIPATK